MSRSVLVTGPVRALESFAQAARNAGWTAEVRALLEIRDVTPEFSLGEGVAVERILITSRNAVRGLDALATDWLELRELPCSVVGAKTAEVLREAGFTISGEPAATAAELAARLEESLPQASTLLWPRGSISDDLAVRLRVSGHEVLDPIVYRTERVVDSRPLPGTDAVFLASPSALDAWCASEREHKPPIAIAIGETTRSSLQAQTPPLFLDILSLPNPTPEALTECLTQLATRLDS